MKQIFHGIFSSVLIQFLYATDELSSSVSFYLFWNFFLESGRDAMIIIIVVSASVINAVYVVLITEIEITFYNYG